MLTRPESPTIRIGRASPLNPHFYDVVLKWIQDHHPQFVPVFELCSLPCELTDWDGCNLFVAWIQDPSEIGAPDVHHSLVQIGEECDRRGIKIVNRAECQANLGKLEAARRLIDAGIRTPWVIQIQSREEFVDSFADLEGPVLVTEDVGHARPCYLVTNREEAEAVPFEELALPVAAEFVDVSSAGRVRKYRCFAIGDRVVGNSLQTSEGWLTRGVNRMKDVQAREEEIEYLIAPDPFEDKMRTVARALEVDYVGIDYGIDSSGEPVIWEANQYPTLLLSKFDLYYRNFAMERTMALMLLSYLEWAGITPPAKLIEQAGYED